MRDVIEGIEDRTSFRRIVEAREAGDVELLCEASLGRVYQHVLKASTKSLAILTAFRGGRSKNDNLDANKKLMGDIRSLGLGAFKLRGRWRECQDPSIPYDDCPQAKMLDVGEPSMGVVGIEKKQAARLGKKYDQDAIVYLGPETDGKAILIFKDGKELVIGAFKPQRIAQAYSKVKGKSFVFEGWEYPAQTHVEVLIEQAVAREAGEASG